MDKKYFTRTEEALEKREGIFDVLIIDIENLIHKELNREVKGRFTMHGLFFNGLVNGKPFDFDVSFEDMNSLIKLQEDLINYCNQFK